MTENNNYYDVIIIGGGATGIGTAIEASSRGYKTLLIEKDDFGKSTSSKSSKLIHGGLRYLNNFEFNLISEALYERYLLIKKAPHLVELATFVIPYFNVWEFIKYRVGLKIYDMLSGNYKFKKSSMISNNSLEKLMPQLLIDKPNNKIKGAFVYCDGKFDDARLLITLMKTAIFNGAVLHNYHEVKELIQQDGNVIGVKIYDKTNELVYNTYGKVIINATGVFANNILNMLHNYNYNIITASKGIHLVFDKKIFPSEQILVIPKTIDKRLIFVINWHNKVVVGTTDAEVNEITSEPVATKEEIDFILNTLNQYLKEKVSYRDIESIFAGLRPLIKEEPKFWNKIIKSKDISRKHKIYHNNGLFTIIGGKWTIYRKMGLDIINYAIKLKKLSKTKSISHKLQLLGYIKDTDFYKNISYPLSVYGSDYKIIHNIQNRMSNFDTIHPKLPYYIAEIIYQIQYEKAKTVEDILSRRTRALFLDAKSAMESAPLVAKIMAKELKKDNDWINNQIQEFYEVAKNYIYK